MVVLNGSDHKILLNKSYNTFTNKRDDSTLLVQDFKTLPDGSVILVSVKDDASKNLSDDAK
jgi:hypothetical protein